jgi:hypothetical protein
MIIQGYWFMDSIIRYQLPDHLLIRIMDDPQQDLLLMLG